MRFLLSESMKNLIRCRKRYLPLGILLFICALLSGAMLPLASAVKQYLAAFSLPDAFDPVLSAQRSNLLVLDSSSSLLEVGILLVFAAALLYVSSLAVNERIGDMGILLSVGLSKKVILGGMLLELSVLSVLTMTPAFFLGKSAAGLWLRTQVQSGVYPQDILTFFSGRMQTVLLFLPAAALLLLPLGLLTVKIAKSDPVKLLGERN